MAVVAALPRSLPAFQRRADMRRYRTRLAAVIGQVFALVLGCLILGAMQDLVTQEPFGLYAFGYGLVGVLLNGVGRVVNRAHPLTHVVCVGMAGLMMGAVVWLHGVIRPEGRAVHPWLLGLLGQAVYTTILGLGVLTVLQRMGGAFGFAPTRRRGY